MDSIEFIARSDKRFMNNYLDARVKREIKEFNNRLDVRQERLRQLVEEEDIQQAKQLSMVMTESQLQENQNRLDAIVDAVALQKESEKIFLHRMQLMRQIQNDESRRAGDSRKITREVKYAQKMQIAENRARTQTARATDQVWFMMSEAHRRAAEEQQMKELELKKAMAKNTAAVLKGQMQYLQYLKELENEEKEDESLANQQAKTEQLIKRDQDLKKVLEEKNEENIRIMNELQLADVKKLAANRAKIAAEKQANTMNALECKEEEEALRNKKNKEKESLQQYLHFIRTFKRQLIVEEEMEDVLMEFNQPQPRQTISKKPYRKSVR